MCFHDSFSQHKSDASKKKKTSVKLWFAGVSIEKCEDHQPEVLSNLFVFVFLLFVFDDLLKKGLPSPSLANHNALVNELVVPPHTTGLVTCQWEKCVHDTAMILLYMDLCENPPDGSKNLSAIFERFYQVVLFPSPVLEAHWGSVQFNGSWKHNSWLSMASPRGATGSQSPYTCRGTCRWSR